MRNPPANRSRKPASGVTGVKADTRALPPPWISDRRVRPDYGKERRLARGLGRLDRQRVPAVAQEHEALGRRRSGDGAVLGIVDRLLAGRVGMVERARAFEQREHPPHLVVEDLLVDLARA